MYQDLRTEPLDADLDFDVCIVGAGAAGITLARQFDAGTTRVCLVESGGLSFDMAIQELYQPEEVIGRRYPVDRLRLRLFGGTTNHWTGVCGLPESSALQPRPWAGYHGWPLAFDTLLPYFKQAHEVLELGDFDYDPDNLLPGWRELGFDPAKFVLRVLRNSPPTRFSGKYAPQIAESENIHCLLYGNLVDFETNDAATRVERVHIATLDGQHARIKARVFVLAAGGLENPRLLLSASSVPGGLGNRHDQVGRYFADHIHYNNMSTVMARNDWWQRLQGFAQDGVPVMPVLVLADEVQRREGLLAHRLGLGVSRCSDGVHDGRICLSVNAECEQIASPDNRVVLGEQRDALGMRKIRLHWRLDERERATIQRVMLLLAGELGRLGMADVRLGSILAPEEFEKRIWVGAHHMGTTRMSERPQDGVVDADCRVHGVDNLYVAGSSVFAGIGHINPTHTIVALALRLGEHLQSRL